MLCFSFMLVAQQENIFLKRNFWKTNPSIEIIEQKINEGHNVAQLNKHAFDGVIYAILEKTDNATIKYLLTKKGNDVNKLTHDGRTYVFWAAYKDNLEIMSHLINKGADTKIIDSHGYSLLNFAAVTGQLNPKLYDLCILNGANPVKEVNRDGANALLLVAPFLKDTTLLNYFVNKGLLASSKDFNGHGLFNYAAKGGYISFLKTLYNLDIKPNKKTTDGANAMYLASKGTRNKTNNLEVFKYLKAMNVKANITTKKGYTPLHALSFKNKDLSIFEYFIQNGVDINQKDNDGNTAFFNAIEYNDLNTIQFLYQYITDINVTNNKGETALMLALKYNNAAVVSFIMNKGANLEIKDHKKNTIITHFLTSYNHSKKDDFTHKLNLLKANNVDLETLQAEDNSLLHLAVKTNNISLVKFLEPLNFEVNAKNKKGYTPLHLAVMKAKDVNLINYLLDLGANKTIRTDYNETAYDLALENELLANENTNLNFLK